MSNDASERNYVYVGKGRFEAHDTVPSPADEDMIIENSLGDRMPVGVRVHVPCEAPGCMNSTTGYYTTCVVHTKLLQLVGAPLKFTSEVVWRYYYQIPERDTVFDFRFSASYASRYNNCHGSANLEEAIPGFEHPTRNEDGAKGEGTRLHKIFEAGVSNHERLRDAAVFLRELAEIWGPERTKFLQQSEKSFIIGWFLRHKTPPPFELALLQETLLTEKLIVNPDKTPKLTDSGQEQYTVTTPAPLKYKHLADAFDYVANIIATKDPETLEVLVEVKRPAEWLTTKPNTTVDCVIRDKDSMDVLDLKMGDIQVSPINNEQLMYYGETFIINPHTGERYTDITLHIIQRNFTDEWTLPPVVLEKWADRVKDSEQAILDGDLTLSPGKHCTFCPANPHGRGDRGTKACPAMMRVLYGARDEQVSDEEIVSEGDIDD